jgi:hypothetical protein
MLIDYALFGDVMTFDTRYSTNKEYRPFGVFVGFNHFREIVVFGAALLYDETLDSFRWLFETFLAAHNRKHQKQFLPIKMRQWEGQLVRCLLIQYMVCVVGIWVKMQ